MILYTYVIIRTVNLQGHLQMLNVLTKMMSTYRASATRFLGNCRFVLNKFHYKFQILATFIECFKGLGKAKCLKKMAQKRVVLSLTILLHRQKTMNNNLCHFMILLSTYEYFLRRTIMFWSCVI